MPLGGDDTQVSFLKTIFPSQNGHDGSTDVQQRARRSNRRRQEGIKIVLEAIFTLWRQVETKVRAKIHKMKVTTKVNRHDKINGKRKTAKEHLRKLSIKEREHAEKERQLSEAEENGKLDMKEIHTYKEMFQRAQALRRWAEDYHKCKIPPSARKPLCNWVRMAAAEHRHSSGLPYWPYLTAETLKNRMGHQPPPPTQPRCITHNSLSLKTPPECPLHPLPPSADDNLKTPPECLITPLPPSAPPSAPPSVDDNLKTPAECLITPLPPSVDDNLNTPAECLITPLPPSAPPSVDNNLNTPPQCLLYPPPPSADDNFKTPPECLITPLPPSADDHLKKLTNKE
ncbi:nuclear pore complex-interacting protein family member A7 isoform X8 [Pan paniscus]|uniref:nuclear pore complex-interacting protein family member A7 isoform X8 n=1 Tax=Pan paniscus TaxID=9597 RepID=UPI003005BD50